MSTITNKQVNDYLTNCGIRHSTKGYTYLMFSIRQLLDERLERGKMGLLYEAVKQEFNAPSAAGVDSCIRNAIRHSDRKGLSNREFIARVLDDLIFADD